MCIRDRLYGVGHALPFVAGFVIAAPLSVLAFLVERSRVWTCLLYTSDAADERSSVDLGGRRIIKKKNRTNTQDMRQCTDHIDVSQR